MKKTIFFMLIIILIISIPVSLFAEETSDESLNKRDFFDALKVDYNMIKEAMCNYSVEFRDIINTINFEEDVTIIKKINTSPLLSFSNYSTIDDILEYEFTRFSSGRARNIFYVMFINGNQYEYFTIQDNSVIHGLPRLFYYSGKELDILLESEVLKHLPSETIVSNVFYFQHITDDGPDDGSALYYCTNNGDFVYHRDTISGIDYIFPSSVFFDLMKKVDDKYLEDEEGVMGSHYTIHDVGYFPEYQIGSDSFFLKDNYHNPETSDKCPMLYIVVLLSIVVLGIILKNNRISITGNVPCDKHK